MPQLCSCTSVLLHKTWRGLQSRELSQAKQPTSTGASEERLWVKWAQFPRNRSAESYCQSTSPYTSVFICIISLFPCHSHSPVLLIQWISWFVEVHSSPPTSIPLSSLRGSLGRGRGGGAGGGILCLLPQEELLEDWVHLATYVLWDEINDDERGNETKLSLFSAPSSE